MGQALYRKIQSLGLAEKYVSDRLFSLQCKMLLALAFVPSSDVLHSFDLFSKMEDQVVDQDIIQYSKCTYIGETKSEFVLRPGTKSIFRIKFVAPNFSIPFWNVHDRVLNDVQRTNNSIEAWHLQFRYVTVKFGCILYNLFNCIFLTRKCF